MNSVLIVGGDSTIGLAIAQACSEHNITAHRTTRRSNASDPMLLQVDLASEPTQWAQLPKVDVAYICAAVAKLDVCEAQPEATALVNVEHTQQLTAQLLARGTHVIFFSTNQVFDGSLPLRSENEQISPLSEYGRQKAAVETWLRAQAQHTTIIRMTKVIAQKLPVMRGWHENLARGEHVEAFTDLYFAPVPLSDVIEAALMLGMNRLGGMYHASGETDISYFDAAQQLARHLAVDEALVHPVTAVENSMPPQLRPRYTSLKRSTCFNDLPDRRPFDVLGIS